VTITGAVIIGLAAGVLVVFSVMFFDRVKIDDPVGAISVHLVCGIWGTLAVGIFSTNPEHTLGAQALGIAAYGGFTFVSALAIFFVLKMTLGIRVSEEEELEGLDLGEHGQHAYDLATGPGWLEQQTGATARVARAPHTTLATSENA
jgi:Amt family ammonium transporter